MGRLLRVGLTGGIGSGKSTVARLLEMMGAAVYVADDRAKELMKNDIQLKEEIIHLLGPEAYLSNGTVNRPYIAARVFGHPDRLALLNAAVHPAVARDFQSWVQSLETTVQRPTYAVEEAAVLIESGAWKTMDVIVAVTAPVEVRLRRVMQRDGATREMTMQRIEAQLDESTRLQYAQYIVTADDVQLLIPQVVALHTALCKASEAI